MGKFSEVSSIGGYPIIYVGDGDVYCGTCAGKMDKSDSDKLVGRMYEEGSPIECDECGKQMESAYGDPDDN